MGDVVPIRGYQHLVKYTPGNLGVRETRCGTTIEIRSEDETTGLRICPACTAASANEKVVSEVVCKSCGVPIRSVTDTRAVKGNHRNGCVRRGNGSK